MHNLTEKQELNLINKWKKSHYNNEIVFYTANPYLPDYEWAMNEVYYYHPSIMPGIPILIKDKVSKEEILSKIIDKDEIVLKETEIRIKIKFDSEKKGEYITCKNELGFSKHDLASEIIDFIAKQNVKMYQTKLRNILFHERKKYWICKFRETLKEEFLMFSSYL